MANNDKIIGLLMAILAIAGIIVELIFILLYPATNSDALGSLAPSVYWAVAIPVLLGVVGVLAIVTWIGFTMFSTPPPEAWDFDDLEEEFDEDFDAEEIGEEDTETSSDEDKSIDNLDGVTSSIAESLRDAGLDTVEKIAASKKEDLLEIKGVGDATANKILAAAQN